MPINNLIRLFRFALLLVTLTLSGTSYAQVALTLAPGWNLLGNSTNTSLPVSSVIGNPANISSVWKWETSGTTSGVTYPAWAFYSPLQADGGKNYASGKGYDFLTTINGGEGFWVNAQAASTATLPAGSALSLAAANLAAGWNLVATADNITPATFSANVGNVSSLWAWDNANSAWYFYAPSLDANSTLASYIQSKKYENFGALTLGNGLGFWVNYALPFPVNGPITTFNTTPLSVTLTGTYNGSPITYTATDTPVTGNQTFLGQPASAMNTIATISGNGTSGAVYSTNYFSVAPFKSLGSSTGGSSVSYTVYANQVPLPETATIGSSGNSDTSTDYTDSNRSTILDTFVERWSLMAGPAPGTANICNIGVYTAVASSATSYTSSTCITIDGSGNILGAQTTGPINGTNVTMSSTAIATLPSVISTSPANSATSVAPNSAIAATFNKTVDAATLTNATFTLMSVSGKWVAGTVTASGNTAIFAPSSSLAYNTTYSAALSPSIKDLSGNQMSASYSWTFTTVAAPAQASSPLPPLSQAVTYQIDYAHSGQANLTGPLTFPNAPTWSSTFSGALSYPLIAGGKVFVLAADPISGKGTHLYALDETTGSTVWGPVSIAGTIVNWAGHAYDNGKIFVVNFTGQLQSFDAATGQADWSIQLPGQTSFETVPMAVNGVVYVVGAGSGGTLYAVDELFGVVLWTSFMPGGGLDSSPAASPDGVFLSYACNDYKFNPLTGASVWTYSSLCAGSGKTAVYANGLLYATVDGLILNATSGAQIGSFPASLNMPISALTSQYQYLQNSGTLQAIDVTSRNVAWSFIGDGNLISAPIVINQYVVIGSSSGNVYALDSTTGAQVWSGNAGAAIAGPNEQSIFQPLTGFGAGEGYLVVPAGNVLTAWKVGP